jgi:hypothetical protein
MADVRGQEGRSLGEQRTTMGRNKQGLISGVFVGAPRRRNVATSQPTVEGASPASDSRIAWLEAVI